MCSINRQHYSSDEVKRPQVSNGSRLPQAQGVRPDPKSSPQTAMPYSKTLQPQQTPAAAQAADTEAPKACLAAGLCVRDLEWHCATSQVNFSEASTWPHNASATLKGSALQFLGFELGCWVLEFILPVLSFTCRSKVSKLRDLTSVMVGHPTKKSRYCWILLGSSHEPHEPQARNPTRQKKEIPCHPCNFCGGLHGAESPR